MVQIRLLNKLNEFSVPIVSRGVIHVFPGSSVPHQSHNGNMTKGPMFSSSTCAVPGSYVPRDACSTAPGVRLLDPNTIGGIRQR